MVGGGVRAGAALAHDARERLARGDLGAIQEADKRMKPERVLPRRQRRAPSRNGRSRWWRRYRGTARRTDPGRLPPPRPRPGPWPVPARSRTGARSETRSSTRQAVGVEATGPNRPGWSRKRLQVADRVRPVRDGDRQIGQHRAGEVDRHRLVGADERPVPGVDQTGEARPALAAVRPRRARPHPPRPRSPSPCPAVRYASLVKCLSVRVMGALRHPHSPLQERHFDVIGDLQRQKSVKQRG